MATTRRKVLVDCDPGIDDSLALLFLFSQLKKYSSSLPFLFPLLSPFSFSLLFPFSFSHSFPPFFFNFSTSFPLLFPTPRTNCDLVGVTIVHGNNPDLQIMKKNAHLLLSSFGFEGVEVVAGASDPLTRPYAGL